MRIALIAHGGIEIPPRDWGAVEGTIWQRKLRLEQLGHTVAVYNTRQIETVVEEVNRGGYDFAHCHNHHFVGACNRNLAVPWAVTSHHGGWHQILRRGRRIPDSFRPVLEEMLAAPANLVLSDRIRGFYARHGYTGLLGVLPNAVETSAFRFAPRGNGRVICLGAITARKRQAWVARATRGRIRVDFVGPVSDSAFRENETSTYLGVWDRETLHDRLTEYSALVLMSWSEAAPKVVLEGLAAGLNVVVSGACTANLTDEAFVTVLRNRRLRRGSRALVAALRRAVEANPDHRSSIRSYAEQRLDYSQQMPRYLDLIAEVRSRFTGPSG